MQPRLIIFDKDGTLIDNNILFSPVVEEMIIKLSKKKGEEEKLSKFIGYDLKTRSFIPEGFIASQPLEVSVKEISKKLKISEEEVRDSFPPLKFNKKTVVPYVDLEDLFLTLKDEGIKIAINTSDKRKNTERCIKILGIGKYLDMVVCGDDGLKTKPSPDTILYICDELGVSPYETFMVGDTQADIDAGLKAKCGGVFLVREDEKFNKFKNYHVHIKDVNQLNYYL
jgi:HAD superfamily hydrolase (TIGR01549 family)